jgi:hypothetical protein
VSSDEDATLAHGVVIDTHLVARVARVPLLRVDGTVVLGPGQVDGRPPVTVTPVVDLPAEAVGASDDGGDAVGAELPGLAERLRRLRNGRDP